MLRQHGRMYKHFLTRCSPDETMRRRPTPDAALQSISLSKLAGLMDMDVTSLRSQLMLLKQVRVAAMTSSQTFGSNPSSLLSGCGTSTLTVW